jgi:hypothetical protein
MLDRHRASGATFAVSWNSDRPSLTALATAAHIDRKAGIYQAAEPQRAEDVVAVSFGVWRYIVVPGVVELDLAATLEKMSAEVELWPNSDAYDLDVRVGEKRWCVDVKDWRSATRLAADLKRDPPSLPEASRTVKSRVVVPHARANQITVLRQVLPAGVKACTDRQLIADVASAVRS